MTKIIGNEYATQLFEKLNNNFNALGGGDGEEVLFDNATYWNNQTSAEAQGNTTNGRCATAKIPLEGLTALCFTGGANMYFSCAVFYNGNTKIGVGLINPIGVDAAEFQYDMIDVLPRIPEGATHVILQTDKKKCPNSKVVKFTGTPNILLKDQLLRHDYYGLVGDGITDDTAALRAYIYNSSGEVSLKAKTYRITDSIVINTNNLKKLNGCGATIILDNEDSTKVALKVTGPHTGTADVDKTLNQYRSASFTIEDLRVTSKSGKDYIENNNSGAFKGIGISITGCMKLIMRGCFVYMLDKGVKVYGHNRDLMFIGNNIYACQTTGLEFSSGVNLHQLNICSNHISFCKYNIDFDAVDQIANVQITGNDIETSTIYPVGVTEADKRCIRFNCSNTLVLYEVEISGNTIQGHGNSNGADHIIEIIGVGETLMSITGNHISNCGAAAISITSATDISICGNTMNNTAGGFVYLAGGTIQRVAVSGNTMKSSGKYLVSSALGATLSGISVTGNVGNNTSVNISSTTQDYISVVGNCLGGGTVTIGDATHKQEANNI